MRGQNLSSDGKWRSFPKVPHLLQYASNGNYYGRLKDGGKIIREALATIVWTTAKPQPTNGLKKHQKVSQRFDPPRFGQAVEGGGFGGLEPLGR